jgi:glycosyltransferase involved in cell wall biosynthesis
MTVTFFSSVLNHHQITFCEELYNTPDVTFTFVQMIDLTEERRAQGFTAYYKPYVVYVQRERERAHRLCIESDVVIAGVIDQSWANERAALGKLTFAYRERFLKSAKSFFSPAFWKNGYLNFFRYRNKELYFLCASSYTARDTRFIFPRADKKLKWGYFPIINIHSDAEGVWEGKKKGTALWVGRFLDWKHPDACIELAKRLRDKGISLNIALVGLGEMQPVLERMIKDENLEGYVSILGQMSPEQVKEQMRKNEIFLFTSDRKEGWGAVLNEAMSEGCACISSRQAGSTEFLIKDGENGFIFDYSDIDTLVNRVQLLIDNPEKMRNVQRNALDTIKNEWNAQTAAERLLAFCRCKLEGKEPPQYESGPMSVS